MSTNKINVNNLYLFNEQNLFNSSTNELYAKT